MRQTYYQAYRQVLEAEQNRMKNVNAKYSSGIKTKDVSNDKFVKTDHIKSTVGKMNTAESPKEQKIEHKEEKEQDNAVIRPSQNGLPVDRKARKFIRAKDMNAKYRGEMKSPFYTEKKGRCSPESGIFSMDEQAVAAALSNEVPTNKPVQSKMIKDANGFNSDFNIGKIDALSYQCFNGNNINAKNILKEGYDVPSSYEGLNPITAAIHGRSINTLRLVLSVPKIATLVNKKDGFGNYPLEEVAKIRGIDPYEFAKILIEYGAKDNVRTDSGYSAAMLTIVNRTWTPNLFGELLPVTDLDKKSKEKLNLREMAEKMDNREAVLMIDNFNKFGIEAINQSVTHSSLINHI